MAVHTDPRSDIEAETQRQKTALVYRSAGVAQAVNVVNATLLASVNASLQGIPRVALAWWVAAVAIAAGRYVLARRFRAASPDANAAAAWRRRYVGVTVASAVTWGIGASALFMWNAPDGPLLFTGLVLCGMVAGAVPLLAPVPAAFRTFALLLGIPMAAVVLLQASSLLRWSFGGMGIVFVAAMLVSARYLHETLDSAIRLQLEEERLAASQRLLEAAIEQSASAVIITDTRARITFVNAAFCRTTGYSAAEALGRNPRFLKSGETPPETYRDLWAALLAGRVWRGELRNRKKSGELFWEDARLSPVVDAEGRTSHYLAVKDDITLRKQADAEIARLATTDPLTGVANRRRFLEQLGMELERVRRFGEPAALLMLDLDHFKRVNDTHGHAAGDAVLQHVAELAHAGLRRVDLFGRLGGEEFAMLLPGTEREGARLVAERFRRQVADTPARAGEGAIPVTVSIGVAMLGRDDPAPDAVLARADAALYRAKQAGRDRVEAAESEGDDGSGAPRPLRAHS